MKPAHARHRTDTGSAELIELLTAMGVGYIPLGGAIDGAAYLKSLVVLVDWKGKPHAKRTKTQLALVAKGAPIWFCAKSDDVIHLVEWMRSVIAKVAA